MNFPVAITILGRQSEFGKTVLTQVFFPHPLINLNFPFGLVITRAPLSSFRLLSPKKNQSHQFMKYVTSNVCSTDDVVYYYSIIFRICALVVQSLLAHKLYVINFLFFLSSNRPIMHVNK